MILGKTTEQTGNKGMLLLATCLFLFFPGWVLYLSKTTVFIWQIWRVDLLWG
jgi:hypothetical protein